MKKAKALTIALNIIVLISVFSMGTLAENLRREITAVEAKDITLNYNSCNFNAKDANGNMVYPLLVDGTSYLPTRAICDIAGLDVDWDNKTKTVLLSKEVTNPATAISPNESDETWELMQTARRFLIAAKNKDYSEIDAYIAPTGCTFVPYKERYYPGNDTLVTINKGEIETLVNNKESILWGYTDGKGDAIQLTVDEYFNEFVYNTDYLNAPKIYTNKGVTFPMDANAIEHFNTDTIFVDFTFPWVDPQYQGMDWQSMRLVFEKINGKYMVIAVVHGCWTI